MNAPLNTAETPTETLLHPSLDELVPSPTQPRIRNGFDDASLGELAASIGTVDVAQPILMRVRQDGKYEIVCGERRWRASRLAGKRTIPAILRTLTDIQVVQIQLIENVQRKDLDEIEEAEGYHKLLQQTDPDTGKPFTADRLAELQGVSKGTIYARLKLLDLCAEARKVFFEGKLEASTALLIARVSPEKIQMEALGDILRQEMSYRRARDHIQRKYMLELKQAIFDITDATLVKKSGACAECPKRTGNQPELFGDVKNKDVCTDPVCYGMKKAAHYLNIRNQAEAEGAKIITGDAAKKILPYNHAKHYLEEKGFATPDTKIPNDPKGRTWGQAIKQTKAPIKAAIIENPHEKGEIIQAFNMADAAKALREQGYEITLRGQDFHPVKTEKEKAEASRLKAKTKAENIYRARLAQSIHEKAEQALCGENPQLHPEIFRLLAKEIYNHSKAYAVKKNLASTALGAKAEKMMAYEIDPAFIKHMDTLTPQQCLLIMVDLIIAREEKVEDWQVKNKDEPDTMLALATMHGIDAAALKTEAEQEVKTAMDAKKKKAAPKKAAATPAKKTPAKNAGNWPFPSPAEGVAANQDAPAAVKPAKKKSTASQPQGATA
jgi:ParB/RepB/Spo0J family partition protein